MLFAATPRSLAFASSVRVNLARRGFHAAPLAHFAKGSRTLSAAAPGVETATASNAADLDTKSKVHGSYHWNFERGLSVVTIPLVCSALALGPIPLVDFGLGVVLPLHTHMGFDCMVQDYIPVRKYGALNTVATWTLRVVTGVVLYGCFLFNTTDVGITAFVKRIWTGKL
ncbi:membrane anchor subunit of succinate dehydrogenase, Sdh4 [Podochytrium sp. JEL0797]|nr:membrane anchor subunit of succinate dehydrogenase, Sdh4 [Podochytrium sp. JEL0797]